LRNDLPAIAFLLRKTSLTLTEIRHLGLKQFQEILEEVSFQESVAEYQTGTYVASLLATIANTIPRKGGRGYRVDDFIGMKKPARRTAGAEDNQKAELEALAARFGVKLPTREMRDL